MPTDFEIQIPGLMKNNKHVLFKVKREGNINIVLAGGAWYSKAWTFTKVSSGVSWNRTYLEDTTQWMQCESDKPRLKHLCD